MPNLYIHITKIYFQILHHELHLSKRPPVRIFLNRSRTFNIEPRAEQPNHDNIHIIRCLATRIRLLKSRE